MGTLLNFRWRPQICLIPCFIMWGVFRMESSAYAPFWIRILSNHERAINMGVSSQSCQRQSYGCWTLLVFNCLMYATSTVLHNPCYIPLYVLAFGDPYDNGLLKKRHKYPYSSNHTNTCSPPVSTTIRVQTHHWWVACTPCIHRAAELPVPLCRLEKHWQSPSPGEQTNRDDKKRHITFGIFNTSSASPDVVHPVIQWNYMHGFIIYYSDLQGSGSNWLPQRIWLSRIYTVPIPLMIDQIDANYRELK